MAGSPVGTHLKDSPLPELFNTNSSGGMGRVPWALLWSITDCSQVQSCTGHYGQSSQLVSSWLQWLCCTQKIAFCSPSPCLLTLTFYLFCDIPWALGGGINFYNWVLNQPFPQHLEQLRVSSCINIHCKAKFLIRAEGSICLHHDHHGVLRYWSFKK